MISQYFKANSGLDDGDELVNVLCTTVLKLLICIDCK